MTEALKLTTYFGERDRAGDRFLADALSDIYARHELLTSLVLRGVEGFGAKQALRTDRLLTLSEDLPIVSMAVDRRAPIEAALADVRALEFDGLVTLERAQLAPAAPEAPASAPAAETAAPGSARVQTFLTRPDLRPPTVRVTQLGAAAESTPRFILLSPINAVPA